MLNITSTLEQTFRERAHAHGLTEDQYFARLLEADDEAVTASVPPQPTSKTPLPETREETKARVQALLKKWQAQDPTFVPSEPKTLAELSAEWAIEDANLTDEEREADRLFWEERERDYERWRGPKG